MRAADTACRATALGVDHDSGRPGSRDGGQLRWRSQRSASERRAAGAQALACQLGRGDAAQLDQVRMLLRRDVGGGRPQLGR